MRNVKADQVVADGVAKGLHDHEIAKLLGCERTVVRRRRLALGLPAVTRHREPQKFTKEQLTELIVTRRMSDFDAAEQLGASMSLVSYWRRKLGLPVNPKARCAPMSEDAIRAAHAEGLTDRAAAERLGCSLNSFVKRRLELDLEPNPQAGKARAPGAPAASEGGTFSGAMAQAVRRAYALKDPRLLSMVEPHLASAMGAQP